MKNFFEFDRRKKANVVEQVVQQFISYVHDYKLIHGSKIPDLKIAKKELELTDQEIHKILSMLQERGYLYFDRATNEYLVQMHPHKYDFIINVVPAFREVINAGKTPNIINLEKKEVIIDAELATKFPGMVIGEKALFMRRYITADHIPMFYIEFCLSKALLPGVEQAFKDEEPHLEIVIKKYPHQYKHHVRQLNIVTAPLEIRKLLGNHEKNMICTYGKYRFFNSKSEVVESGFAYMTDLTEFTTTSVDLTELMI